MAGCLLSLLVWGLTIGVCAILLRQDRAARQLTLAILGLLGVAWVEAWVVLACRPGWLLMLR